MNEEYPLISVIVPVYNTEQYLAKCVESIQNQTYPNIEIILVDDESPDGSPKLCDELAEKDGKIKVIHQKNRGLGGARNSGKHASHGEYIAFVDSDDYIEPDMYEKMYQALQKYDCQIVSSGFIRESESMTNIIDYPDEVLVSKEAIDRLIKMNQAGGNSACNKLFQRDMILPIDFPEQRLWEDMLVMYRIFEKAKMIATIRYAGYHYVQRGTSIIHDNQGIDECKRVEAFFERATMLEDKYMDLALYSYQGVANECMQNCVRIIKEYGVGTKNYYATYNIGKNAYERIKHSSPLSIKRKLLYYIFFEKNQLFMRVMTLINSNRKN